MTLDRNWTVEAAISDKFEAALMSNEEKVIGFVAISAPVYVGGPYTPLLPNLCTVL